MENNRLVLSQIALGGALSEWHLESIFDDEVPTVKSFRGKAILILFFNLGCSGCVGRAVPYANRVVYENGEKIHVLGIHTNFEGVDFNRSKLEKAKQDLFIRFPFYRDKNHDTTFLNYGAGGTPHWILINKDGEVDYSIFGSDPNNALLRLDLKINELLN